MNSYSPPTIPIAVPKESTRDLSPGFFASMIELHFVMKNVNNNMKPKEDEVVSRPWHWPILYKGIGSLHVPLPCGVS